jgi:DNA-binding beta-propeller fold protein YncE
MSRLAPSFALLLLVACSDSRVQSTQDDDDAGDDDVIDDDDAGDDDATDDDDDVQNQLPIVAILAPQAADALYSDVPVTLEAQAFDPEDLYADLRVTWTVDGTPVASDLVPDDQGRVSSTATLDEGSRAIAAAVTDTAGAIGTAAITVEVRLPEGGPCDDEPVYVVPTCGPVTGVYFSDIQAPAIHRMDPDGSNLTQIYDRVADDLEVDLPQGTLYWVWGDAIIERGPLAGGAWEVVQASTPYGYGIALDPFARHIYWTNQVGTPKVQRSCRWGGDAVDVLATLGPGGNCCAIGIDIDFLNGTVYWMDGYYGGPVSRMDLDGSNVTGLYNTPGIGNGVAVDHRGGKIYWTEYGNSGGQDAIRRANLDGTNVETLLDSSDGLDTPQHIAVDPDAGKIYWADLRGATKVGRANLDGSNVEALYTGGGDIRAVALERESPCQ